MQLCGRRFAARKLQKRIYLFNIVRLEAKNVKFLWTRKELEEECARRVEEDYYRRSVEDQICRIRDHVARVECDLIDLRMKVDPDFRKQHTPTCERCQE